MIGNKIKKAFWVIIIGLTVAGMNQSKHSPAATFDERFSKWDVVTLPEPEPPPSVRADVPEDTLWQMGRGYVGGRCAVLGGRTLCKWDEAAI